MSTREQRQPVTYPPYEEQHQKQERARRMQWARPYWCLTLDDAQFAHDHLRESLPFSGDLRPTDIHPQPKELTA